MIDQTLILAFVSWFLFGFLTFCGISIRYGLKVKELPWMLAVTLAGPLFLIVLIGISLEESELFDSIKHIEIISEPKCQKRKKK